jgi:hypothetical protein
MALPFSVAALRSDECETQGNLVNLQCTCKMKGALLVMSALGRQSASTVVSPKAD